MLSRISIGFFLLFCLQKQILSTPVILWSTENIPQSPVSLSELTAQNLISDHICALTDKQVQLRIIAVNDLTTEDIQRGQERKHQLLQNAQNDDQNYRYYPNVQDQIYNALTLLPQSNSMKCAHIHFSIVSSKVYQSLHDALNIMQTTIENSNDKPTLIVLVKGPVDSTSKLASRERRQTDEDNAEVLLSADRTCMFTASQLYWKNANGTHSSARTYTFNYNVSSCRPYTDPSTGNITSVIVALQAKNVNEPFDVVTVNLYASLIGLYWYLTNATLNNNGYRYFAYGMASSMDTPPTFSYVCTTSIFVQYSNLTSIYGNYNFSNQFYLTNLQFQPFNGNGIAFGQPNYCTSFFTSGIWMGVTSSLLCLGILLFGVHRMMTIKSNDRFDDPKGKPLIIKAQD